MSVQVAGVKSWNVPDIAQMARMIRTTFLMEQHIGHYSYYQNLRRFIDRVPEIQATWVPITYYQKRSWLNWIPMLGALRGTLVGRKQVETGLHANPFDIAVFNTQVPASLGFQWLSKQPYVVCTDISPCQLDQMAEHYQHNDNNFSFVADAKHRTNVRMFQNAQVVLPWSSWVARSIIEDYGVSAEKVEVLPPGVDLDTWYPDASQRTAAVPRILFVGGDFKRKGGELLLEAFRRLPPGSAELHIVTKEPLAPQTGVTVYNDMRPNSLDLVQLYQACHIFCLPTHAEAFGIVAIEASATGLPVVATDVGGLADVVDDGVTGYLIRPNDVAMLTERLQYLVEHPSICAQMGDAARLRVEDRFDARKNGQRLVEILQTIWQNLQNE